MFILICLYISHISKLYVHIFIFSVSCHALFPLALQIDDLDGSSQVLEPYVHHVDTKRIIVTILSSNGATSVSSISVTVCCHPTGTCWMQPPIA